MLADLFLLFSHSLTDDQENQLRKNWDIKTIRALPEKLQQCWSNVPPDKDELKPHLQPILDWLERESSPGDLVLVQGDFGATYLAVTFCFRHQLVPVYATTRRVHRECVDEGGTISTSKVFLHRMFREYGK